MPSQQLTNQVPQRRFGSRVTPKNQQAFIESQRVAQQNNQPSQSPEEHAYNFLDTRIHRSLEKYGRYISARTIGQIRDEFSASGLDPDVGEQLYRKAIERAYPNSQLANEFEAYKNEAKQGKDIPIASSTTTNGYLYYNTKTGNVTERIPVASSKKGILYNERIVITQNTNETIPQVLERVRQQQEASNQISRSFNPELESATYKAVFYYRDPKTGLLVKRPYVQIAEGLQEAPAEIEKRTVTLLRETGIAQGEPTVKIGEGPIARSLQLGVYAVPVAGEIFLGADVVSGSEKLLRSNSTPQEKLEGVLQVGVPAGIVGYKVISKSLGYLTEPLEVYRQPVQNPIDISGDTVKIFRAGESGKPVAVAEFNILSITPPRYALVTTRLNKIASIVADTKLKYDIVVIGKPSITLARSEKIIINDGEIVGALRKGGARLGVSPEVNILRQTMKRSSREIMLLNGKIDSRTITVNSKNIDIRIKNPYRLEAVKDLEKTFYPKFANNIDVDVGAIESVRFAKLLKSGDIKIIPKGNRKSLNLLTGISETRLTIEFPEGKAFVKLNDIGLVGGRAGKITERSYIEQATRFTDITFPKGKLIKEPFKTIREIDGKMIVERESYFKPTISKKDARLLRSFVEVEEIEVDLASNVQAFKIEKSFNKEQLLQVKQAKIDALKALQESKGKALLTIPRQNTISVTKAIKETGIRSINLREVPTYIGGLGKVKSEYYGRGLSVSIDSEVSNISILNIHPKSISNTKSNYNSPIKYKEINDVRTREISREVTRTQEKTIIKEEIKTNIKEVLKTNTRQEIKLNLRLNTRLQTRTPPRLPPTRVRINPKLSNRIKPIGFFGFGKAKPTRSRTGYKTFVIRGGKKQYLPGINPKGLALKAGELKAVRTLRATFGIEKTNVKVNRPDVSFKVSNKQFRSFRIKGGRKVRTPNIYIQRTRKEGGLRGGRLSSIGEIREIKLSRLGIGGIL